VSANLDKAEQELEAARKNIVELERKLAEARLFGENAAKKYNEVLHDREHVTCAFCGHVYPRGTPRHGDGALAGHIKVCPEHPMRGLEGELDELRKRVDRALRQLSVPNPCASGLSTIAILASVERILLGEEK
jgi:hypothetical protein